MQEASCAYKVKFLVDGTELPNIVKLGEVNHERAAIDVPGFQRIVKIDTGVEQQPEVSATFETRRNTTTRATLQDWYNNHETHDCTVIYCDATGTEMYRDIWTAVECRKYNRPEVDHGAVTYAHMDVVFLPYDIKPVEST